MFNWSLKHFPIQSETQVANPDFMAVLAPQWPEPDPDPTEDQAFLQQQVSNLNSISVTVFADISLREQILNQKQIQITTDGETRWLV